jgi:hypothetical protein
MNTQAQVQLRCVHFQPRYLMCLIVIKKVHLMG